MATPLLGWTNYASTGAVTAGSEEVGLGVTNWQIDQGSPAQAWQTKAGVLTDPAGAYAIIDSGSDATSWRLFLLARTNLTPAATVRWRVGPLECFVEDVADLDVNFGQASFTPPSGWNFARASAAYYFDGTGTLQAAAADAARTSSYDFATGLGPCFIAEESRSNFVRNPRAEGGTAGAPGTTPTYWTVSAGASGLSIQNVAIYNSKGVTYQRYRFYGTASSSAASSISMENGGGPTGLAAGATITESAILAIQAGSQAGISSIRYHGQIFDSAGAVQGDNQPQIQGQLSATYTRVVAAENVPSTGTAPYRKPTFDLLIYPISGQAVDITLDIGLPQVELGVAASTPILPPAGAPAASTRAADQVWIQIAGGIGSAWTFMTDVKYPADDGTAVLCGLGYSAAWSFATASTYITRYDAAHVGAAFLGTGGSYAPNMQEAAGDNLRGKIALSYDSGGVTAMGFDALPHKGVINSGCYFPPASDAFCIAGASWSPLTAAGGLQNIYRVALWKHRLSDARMTALVLTGSTITGTAGAGYDTGNMPAGVMAGYGQSVTVAPATVTGRYCVVDINDPGNPDGFINVPLAYAGPAWQMTGRADTASALGRDSQIDEVTTRGGQEYPVAEWQRRRLTLSLSSIRGAEVWSQVMALDQFTRGGGNVVFVLDPDSAAVSQETVFGRLKATADLGYPYQITDRRSWKATITERL